eukprot:CAMPEP_0177692720 /NCGR_PEP_ID=MMETSP0484_2-20121128/2002_1 /TAXON_ID=354590 /ORGANISM="Rhodomonas lens, Strain RHODO" /LENGTH=628 /DNA_ID=CAMNT_0019203453 /DNA_START=137 /DNA_END=2021 /DNA_ORIENTATION=-
MQTHMTEHMRDCKKRPSTQRDNRESKKQRSESEAFGFVQQTLPNLGNSVQSQVLDKQKSSSQSQAETVSIKSHLQDETLLTHQSTLSEIVEYGSPVKPRRGRKQLHIGVSGQVSLHPIQQKILDSPHFQLLRHKKQLGTANLVYPSATHSRFEHSLGTAHLVEVYLKKFEEQRQDALQWEFADDDKMWWKDAEQYPDAGADEECFPPKMSAQDKLSTIVGGQIHDLGHGPHSHLFEKVTEELNEALGLQAEWSHEKQTVFLFKDVLVREGIRFAPDDASHDLEVRFIEELILGDKLDGAKTLSEALSKRRGRPRHKWFLYDIVSNACSGLDVDKLDYFMRDASGAMNGAAGSDLPTQFVNNARVCWMSEGDGRGRTCVAWPGKMAQDAPGLFRMRFNMHHKVYQHRKVFPFEEKVKEIYVGAFRAHMHLPILDGNGSITAWKDIQESLKLTADGVQLFLQLDDRILKVVEMYHTPASVLAKWREEGVSMKAIEEREKSMCAARKAAQELERRDTIKFVGQMNLSELDVEPKPEDITPEELDKLEGVDEEEKKALIRKIMKKNRMKKLKKQFKAEILQSESVAESDDEADEADEDASTPARRGVDKERRMELARTVLRTRKSKEDGGQD